MNFFINLLGTSLTDWCNLAFFAKTSKDLDLILAQSNCLHSPQILTLVSGLVHRYWYSQGKVGESECKQIVSSSQFKAQREAKSLLPYKELSVVIMITSPFQTQYPSPSFSSTPRSSDPTNLGIAQALIIFKSHHHAKMHPGFRSTESSHSR